MTSLHAALIVFPGTNRDRDMERALELAGARVSRHWHQETNLPPADLIVLPGGFAHGDYLRCGAMAAVSPIMAAVRSAASRGVAILGVCNGFQMLTEAQLLPGALIRNRDLRFLCKLVRLRVEAACLFTSAYRAGEEITVPIAHHDGNYVCDSATLHQLESEDRIAFRYCDNPNGSMADIAGVLSPNRRILGLMPHPEDRIEPDQGGRDGLGLFRSAVEALSGAMA